MRTLPVWTFLGEAEVLVHGPVAVALLELGTREASGSNDGPVQKYQVDPFNKKHVRAVAWCWYFVAWCYDQCPDWPSLYYTRQDWWENGKVDTFWEKYAGFQVVGADPEPNDLLVLGERGESDPGDGDHVALVLCATPTQVVTVDGNWGNQVALVVRERNDPKIRGILRVRP